MSEPTTDNDLGPLAAPPASHAELRVRLMEASVRIMIVAYPSCGVSGIDQHLNLLVKAYRRLQDECGVT